MARVTSTQVIKEARNILAQPKAWIKGRHSTPDGSFCAIGAIDEAVTLLTGRLSYYGSTPLARRAIQRVEKIVPKFKGRRDLALFNDRSRTRKKDILAVFDKAVKK